MKYFKRFMFNATDGGGSELPGDNNNQDSVDNNGSGDGSADGSTGEDKADNANEKPPEKTYTQADIDGLNSIIEKLRADFAVKLTETAEEAEKKAGMTPEEKKSFEDGKRLKDLEKREQEVAGKQLRIDALRVLSEKGIDREFLDYILSDNLENTAKRADGFKKLFDKKLYEKQAASLAGRTPPANGSGKASDTERDKILKALGGK